MSPQFATVCTEAQSALSESPLYDLRELKVEAEGESRLAIRGMVSSFYHKQLAQEALLTLARSRDVQVVNYVEVIDVLSN
jgi:hypothetical protein